MKSGWAVAAVATGLLAFATGNNDTAAAAQPPQKIVPATATSDPYDDYNGEWTPGSEAIHGADGVWRITVWDNNLARGQAFCDDEVTYYDGPVTCRVVPASEAPFQQEREWGAAGHPGW